MLQPGQPQHEGFGGDVHVLGEPREAVDDGIDGEGVLGELLRVGAEGATIHLVELAVVGDRPRPGQHPEKTRPVSVWASISGGSPRSRRRGGRPRCSGSHGRGWPAAPPARCGARP